MLKTETDCQINDRPLPNGARLGRLLQRLLGSPKRAKRVVQWMVLGALITSALGAAANHFISPNTEDASQAKTSHPPAANPWNQHSSDWWNGPDSTGTPPPNWTGTTSGATGPAPNGAALNNAVGKTSAAAVDGTLHFASASTGLRENPVSIGSNASSGPIAFAGPSWMRNDPISTATRPLSGHSNGKLGKYANNNPAGSLWEVPAQFSSNTGTASTKPFPTSPGGGQSSDGGTVIPVNRDYKLGSGELFLNSPQTPGKTSGSADYAVLGLSTSSSPQDTVASNGNGDLHFSLVGQLTTVPTMSISDSAMDLLPVPEPATCGMLLAGGAVFLSARRRRSSSAV